MRNIIKKNLTKQIKLLIDELAKHKNSICFYFKLFFKKAFA